MVSVLVSIRQNFPKRGLPDVAAAVRGAMEETDPAAGLQAGSRIAIGAGSRGISNLAIIVKRVVDYWLNRGMRPFLFPAMGSHGAGTPEGQASVLGHYGIDESSMGCPVLSTFDVVSLGRTALGVEAFAGRDAWESDGVFLVNRVKWHTSFAGPLESGVTKMMAIGMGKREGAASSHSHGRKHGMDVVIRSVGEHVLQTGKVLGGLAVLEDAWHDTAMVKALPAAGLIEEEQRLLETVKSWKGRLPTEEVDVLIIDEIGKNIAGTGMDLKIVNRGVQGQYNPWPGTPRVERIFIRDLSPLSYGNATGMGLADVVHDRMLSKVDFNAGRVNAQTSGSLATVKTPLHFSSDRECIEVLASTVGRMNPSDVTFAWIRNTLELGTVAISENAVLPGMEVSGAPFAMDFDNNGNLSRLPAA